jgi:hypothetical protein
MLTHERQEYRQQMGHVWMGFSAEQIEQTLDRAGFTENSFLELPADPAAKGPSLFASTAVRGARITNQPQTVLTTNPG